jgi:S-adenosylmethionine hydrolase
MKKVLILFSTIIFLGSVCNAQTDTTKIASDSLILKTKRIIQKDTASTKIQADSVKYALLYVYRPGNFVGAIMSYNLKMTNTLFTDSIIGKVKNNSKFIVKLYQEGKTELWAKTESKKSVFINVKFGQKYYLKCGITMGIFVGRPNLNLIYPEQGVLDYENVEGRKK